MNRILSHLCSLPLLMEQNAWTAFLQRNVGGASEPRPSIADTASPARTCGCDEPSAPPARYSRILETFLLNPNSGEKDPLTGLEPRRHDTAKITISGVLVKHAEKWECEIFGLTDLDDVDAAIAAVAADANIRNVLFNFVNNPGGTCIGTPETADKIYALRRTKNVISFSDSVCCSGGIFLASQASEFFITQSAHTGSIGAIKPPILDFSKNLAMNGVTPHITKAGKFKDTGTELRPPTKEELDMLQAYVDRVMSLFTAAVKRGRPSMSPESFEGQVFFGREAVEVGLADAVVADMAEALSAF